MADRRREGVQRRSPARRIYLINEDYMATDTEVLRRIGETFAYPGQKAIVVEAAAEIERLRAALECIIDTDYVGRGVDGPCTVIARRALEQEAPE